MRATEGVLLSGKTTFRIGGPARLFLECADADDIRAALALARERGLAVYPLGEGSNVLAADGAVEKAILRITDDAVAFEDEGDTALLIAGAGAHWDALVDGAARRELWGIENLAGIPGTAGAAPVQNVGAYGREVKDTCAWVETLDLETGALERLDASSCAFAYRDSRFKREPQRLIVRVAFRLAKESAPRVDYPDLKAAQAAGAPLDTPAAIASAVRAIRARKFPDLAVSGTAGSFFKNPFVDEAHAAELAARYPELPLYPGAEGVKVPLAWILDKALDLRGFARGPVRLFEAQPLVVVAEEGATRAAVDALAHEVEERVFDATRIEIEREVRMLE